MTPEELHCLADWSSILTFAVALIGGTIGVYGYIRSQVIFHRKSKRLENFLREEKGLGVDKGQRSINRIIKSVGLTEDEIIQISFVNPNILRRVTADKITNLAEDLLFEYVDSK